jgi:cysteine desulfurase
MSNHPIYLDHSATTPVDPAVVAAMLPHFTEHYGNPSSHHHYGRGAARALAEARRTVAETIHAAPDEVVFTGCGSESDNLAIRGVMWEARRSGAGNHVVTSAIEHEAVLETCRQLAETFDFDLTVLPVDRYGQVRLAELEAALRPDTALISIMAANNEIGTMQPIAAIGALARERGILFHTDAIQAGGMVAWDMSSMPIDLLSLAPHKFYGPKGVGILIVRRGIELVSALTGGGQEEGRRAGTVNVPFAVGAAEALRLAMARRETDVAHYQTLRDRLIAGVLERLPDECRLTGHPTERLPHHASFAVRDASGNDLLIQLDMAGICVSSGSACSTGDPRPSATLEALALGPRWTRGGLRLTVGRQNTPADVERVIATLPNVVREVQKLERRYAG